MSPFTPLRHDSMVYSKSLFKTITTLHQGDYYRLRVTVARVRSSFESRELNSLLCIPGTVNVADALTNRNVNTSLLVNKFLAEVMWCVNITNSAFLDSGTWC